ncbi:MAG: ABC transporter permease [Desulfobacterales bacterium]|jgi:ABC-type nitrate/sulfonate/bicarbonate transport system permease component
MPRGKNIGSEEQYLEADGWEFEYIETRLYKIARLVFKNALTIGVILGVWFLVSVWVNQARNIDFPTPIDTFLRLIDLFKGEKLYDYGLYDHFLSSLTRWGIAFFLAAVIGLSIGTCLGISKSAKEIVMPIVYFIQLIPGLAWIPIALLMFGIGNAATLFMIFATALPPIIINVTGGIRGVPVIYIKASKMMGASSYRIFSQVMIPAALISTINGLRIGLANGWRVLIAAEMVVGVGLGLGYSIIQARWSLDFESSFVCIILICITGLFFEKIVFNLIEDKVAKHLGS